MRNSRNSRLVSSLLGVAVYAGLLACAQPSAAARLVEVSVINRTTGERLTPVRHGGRHYVAGTPGEKYAIELKSRSGERLLTVLAVDGVNVLTGQTAAGSQSGYVLDAWRGYAINGWRKSMDDVAQFVFTALPDSYAARTGRPDHVGVIGVAVFREKAVPLAAPVEPWRGAAGAAEKDSAARAESAARDLAGSGAAAKSERQSPAELQAPTARQAPAAAAPARSESGALADRRAEVASEARVAPEMNRLRLGTGHGERERSPTTMTEFARASDTPDEVVTIYYDSRPNLIARGIIRSPKLAEPNPFPGGIGFVPDPRG